MPYFIYKIAPGAVPHIKHLEFQKEFVKYKEAQHFAKKMRAQQDADDKSKVKLIFAATPLEAEERLQEHREPPILKEWEK
ncbi:MAG: hypothetical protein GY862_00340 [Gammaproteobacteria bacterium]|nr:hypothetical protein [Gammaproteobacteria bacterium]